MRALCGIICAENWEKLSQCARPVLDWFNRVNRVNRVTMQRVNMMQAYLDSPHKSG